MLNESNHGASPWNIAGEYARKEEKRATRPAMNRLNIASMVLWSEWSDVGGKKGREYGEKKVERGKLSLTSVRATNERQRKKL